MAAKTGTLFINSTDVATTEIEVTDVGFTPTAVLFWWSGRNEAVTTNGSANAQPGVGAATGSANRWANGTFLEDAVESSNTAYASSPDCCIIEVKGDDLIDGRADFVDFTPSTGTGFTLVIDSQFTSDFRVSYLAIDHANATTGALNIASTGSLDSSSLGFDPECVIFSRTQSTSTNEQDSSNAALGLGAATDKGGSIQQWTVHFHATNGNSFNNRYHSYGYTGECTSAAYQGSPGEVNERASFTSMGVDKFTIDVLETSGRDTFYLALAGGQYYAGNRISTDTTTNDAGFEPEAVLFCGLGNSESTQDVSAANINMSIGCAISSTERSAHAWSVDNGVDPSEVWTAYATDQCLISGDFADSTDGLMDLSTMNATGFTTVMDVADSSAYFQGYVALTSTAAESSAVGSLINSGLIK
jgi:hypothetical protein